MTDGSREHTRADDTFPYLPEDCFFQFSEPEKDSGGIIAQGGNLSPGMLLSAYRQGVFPWFNKDDPILWWSPDPRFVLFPEQLHVPEKLARKMKQMQKPAGDPEFVFSADTSFREVIGLCASVKRPGQTGTWILPDMIAAYCELFRLGYAHSFELRHNGKLAGGLYGVLIGQVFFGESMFTLEPDASKAAFVRFVQLFAAAGGKMIDSQVYTDHIARFGGRNISRSAFLRNEHDFLNGTMTGDIIRLYNEN